MVLNYTVPGHALTRTPTIQQRAEEVARRPTHTTDIDLGLPIPDRYDVDMLSVMVQNPYRLHAFWSISQRAWRSLEKIFPPAEVKRFRTVIKLRNPRVGWEGLYETNLATRWWFDVYPDAPYQVEVGFYAPRYGYIRWLRSPQVRTPRIGPGLDSSVTEADVAAPPTSVSASTLIETDQSTVPWWVNQLPAWIRDMVMKLLQGQVLSEDEISQLPDWLQHQLRAIGVGVGLEAMRQAFLEYVPELVYETAPDAYWQILDLQREDMRLVQVGSEIMAQPPAGHRWFPSMMRPPVRPVGVPASPL
ncbi:MAG: DUF4912 domain-containing protein [Acidobacteriota bacterium]|nr:DUF4912 domain-containing protein [Blastocatellia bacterium]MDW8238521.1 DUF4912 domain-containing protein [Acidobacteriota bacterium]